MSANYWYFNGISPIEINYMCFTNPIEHWNHRLREMKVKRQKHV